MAFVISQFESTVKPVMPRRILSCMGSAEKNILNIKDIHNPDLIQQSINTAAEVRQKLEAEAAKTSNSIKLCAEGKQKIDLNV